MPLSTEYNMRPAARMFLLFLSLTLTLLNAAALDQPQWGHAWTRNMVSPERGLPEMFDPKSGLNVKWTARLGSESHSTPVIANGCVLIGTNNDEPRDPRHKGDRGVLMCFNEQDGKLLWQLAVPKRDEDPYFDWPKSGISSAATVEGDRVYIVDNRGQVLCLDLKGMANGNDGPFRDEAAYFTPSGTNAPPQPIQPGPLDADILWAFDLTAEVGIWSHDAAHSSILIHGDHLYLNTGTGVDNTHKKIRTPDAPSLIVLDKHTGKLLARDHENIAPQIFHCTWSAPSFAEVNGKPLIFFAGGNGVVYAFEPLPQKNSNSERSTTDGVARLKKVWQFDCDPAAPKEDVHRYNGNRRESPSNIFGMPVYDRGRIYVAAGGDYWWGKNEAWLKCIDATQSGDITRAGELWSYPLEKHVMSTAAVLGDLVFIADTGRKVHCLDAKSGKAYWSQEIRGDIWASPYVADGKVYIGSRRGDFWVFAAEKDLKIKSTLELNSPISATATAANDVLYIATMTHLYAVATQPPGEQAPR